MPQSESTHSVREKINQFCLDQSHHFGLPKPPNPVLLPLGLRGYAADQTANTTARWWWQSYNLGMSGGCFTPTNPERAWQKENPSERLRAAEQADPKAILGGTSSGWAGRACWVLLSPLSCPFSNVRVCMATWRNAAENWSLLKGHKENKLFFSWISFSTPATGQCLYTSPLNWKDEGKTGAKSRTNTPGLLFFLICWRKSPTNFLNKN